MKFGGCDVVIQLAELSDFGYTKKYDPTGKNSNAASLTQKEYAGELWVVDEEKKQKVLADVLKAKLDKCYSKNKDSQLWLVIFSTSFDCMQAWKTEGNKKVRWDSPALIAANEFLSKTGAGVFDRILYSNLRNNPINLWPQSKGPE